MKKIAVLTFCLFHIVFIQNSFSQEVDTLFGFDEYVVHSAEMESILYEVVSLAKSNPFFRTTNNKFIVLLCLESKACTFAICPQNATTLYFYRSSPGVAKNGVCYFEGQMFFIQNYSTDSSFDTFFARTDNAIDVIVNHSENVYDHIIPINRCMELSYLISDGKLIRNEKDENPKDWCGFNDRWHFVYLIKKDDSWESIAVKCGCKENDLKQCYPEYSSPPSGFLIDVEYVFDEFGGFHGIRRPY